MPFQFSFFKAYRPLHSSLFSTALKIGRKSPFMTLDVVRREFKAELKAEGREIMLERLVRERDLLSVLLKKQERYDSQVDFCVEQIVERGLSGLAIGGEFWEKQQYVLQDLLPKEERAILNDTIDWLKSRQLFAEELLKKQDKEMMLQ